VSKLYLPSILAFVATLGGCADREPRAELSHAEAALLATEQAIAVPSYFRN
jgi:hypothetical protein